MTRPGFVRRPLSVTPTGGSPFDCQPAELGIFLEIVNGLDEVAEVRGEDVRIPSREGMIVGNRIGDRRSIELAGSVRGDLDDGDGTDATRLASYRANVLILQTIFDPRQLVLVEVIGEDGYLYAINALPLSIVYGPEELAGEREVSVALVSTSDPEWTRTLIEP